MSHLIGRGRLLVALAATGLSQAEAARYLDVTPRSVSRWLDGSSPVPAGALRELEALADRIAETACRAAEAVREMGAGRPAIAVYRDDADMLAPILPTASAHRAMVAQTIRHLGGAAVPVLFDPDAYRHWLAGRADTTATRAAWAAMQAGEPSCR